MGHRTYLIIRDELGIPQGVLEDRKTAEEKKSKRGLYRQIMEGQAGKVIEEAGTQIKEYIEKNGYHFTPALAEFASKQMENANGQKHSWNTERIKMLFNTHDMELPEGSTWGDMTYAANMCYADFYPEVAKDEASCIKYACLLGNDPDGYEGMIFKRWCTDMVEKHLHIDWLKFL